MPVSSRRWRTRTHRPRCSSNGRAIFTPIGIRARAAGVQSHRRIARHLGEGVSRSRLERGTARRRVRPFGLELFRCGGIFVTYGPGGLGASSYCVHVNAPRPAAVPVPSPAVFQASCRRLCASGGAAFAACRLFGRYFAAGGPHRRRRHQNPVQRRRDHAGDRRADHPRRTGICLVVSGLQFPGAISARLRLFGPHRDHRLVDPDIGHPVSERGDLDRLA